MVVTGYQLKRVLKDADRRRTLLTSQWDDCLWAFEGEDKPEPEALLEELRSLEAQIARLQETQARYNLAVTVTVRGSDGAETMSMLEAVKRVGGVSRCEAMLQKAAKSEQGYWGNPRSRSLEEEHAGRRLALDRAAELYKEFGHRADALREAIAVGNATEVDLPGLDPDLLN